MPFRLNTFLKRDTNSSIAICLGRALVHHHNTQYTSAKKFNEFMHTIETNFYDLPGTRLKR